jgi:hypothetical protein
VRDLKDNEIFKQSRRKISKRSYWRNRAKILQQKKLYMRRRRKQLRELKGRQNADSISQ